MEKIKQWGIDDINFHLISLVFIAILDLLVRPSLGQFGLQLFGYFAAYFFIKILAGGKKMSEIPWEENIRNMSIGMFNKNSVTINGDVDRENLKKSMDKEYDRIARKLEKKSNWQERLDSMSNTLKSKYDNSSTISMGGSGSSVTVNGKTYQGKGSISIINGKVKIDGKTVTDESRCDNVIVEVKGDLRNLTIDGTATCIINGNVKGNVDSHNLDCGNVEGNVNAHKVRCGTVSGNVNAHKVTKP